MPKRSSRPRDTLDVNQIAARIVEQVTGEAEKQPTKNPAAVMLGRMGGKKGGPARAASLSAKKRTEIARKGAAARWAVKG